MEFNPNNPIIQLCLQGMDMEAKGNPQEASKLFLQAWNESTNDFEKFTAAYYVARHQNTVSDKLKWLETALQYALNVNDVSVAGAFPALYSNIAKCYEELGDVENAKKNSDLASLDGIHVERSRSARDDSGPFYHGTRADLKVGDLLIPGFGSNYQAELRMNHIYFTAIANGAGLAAALANGEGHERVYIVEPTGSFENDPNVTDKKFPGNPTRSYRTEAPLKVVGEATDWVRMPPEQLQKFRERLANNRGDIIN